MEIDIQRLAELQDVKKRRAELICIEQALSRPALTDLSQIERMHDLFSTIPSPSKENRYVVRKQFIFIAVWVFCPGALIGERSPNNFRKELAKAMHLRSPQIISEELKDLLFYYTTYPQFRSETDRKFKLVTMGLSPQ